jgi:hypothetical protein
LIIAGATWPLVLVLPGTMFDIDLNLIHLTYASETYPPVILLRRARRMRTASPDRAQNVYAPMELEDKGWKHTVTVKLARPVCDRLFIINVS